MSIIQDITIKECDHIRFTKSKYRNKKVVVDGITFDSLKESKRYKELKELEHYGYIKDLELQPKFLIQGKYKKNGKTIRAIHYIADFRYFDVEKGKYVIEDVKGVKTDVYKLKKKLVEKIYDIEVVEI